MTAALLAHNPWNTHSLECVCLCVCVCALVWMFLISGSSCLIVFALDQWVKFSLTTHEHDPQECWQCCKKLEMMYDLISICVYIKCVLPLYACLRVCVLCVPMLFLNLDLWADVLCVCVRIPFVCMCCQMYSSALVALHVFVHSQNILSASWVSSVTGWQGQEKWVSHALSRHERDRQTDT